jgi:adenosylhomocysteine nucleosidase
MSELSIAPVWTGAFPLVQNSNRTPVRRCISGLAVLALLLATGCATAPRNPKGFDAKDPTPRLAIVSAFAPELEKLREHARIERERVINGRTHYIGQLAGHQVVLLLSGYSMVNASMTAQSLLDHFTVREIIFSGIAGGVNPNLRIGDVTVPSEWAQYQEQHFARQTAGGWDTGIAVTNLGHFEMMFPQPALVTRRDGPANKEEARVWFPVDPASLRIAQTITNGIILANVTAQGERLTSLPRVVVGGRGVSGPTFVDNAAYREWVWNNFHADALDMESAAVATVAYVNNVPFIAFRSLSDLAGGGEGRNEVFTFLKLAAANSAAVVLRYLEALDERQLPPVGQTANQR